MPAPRQLSIPFSILFSFLFSLSFLFLFSNNHKSQPHELQSHISQVLYNHNYKYCTIKIDSRNKSCNHNQEISLAQSRNKFLQSKSRNNRKHNSSTIPPAAAPTSSAPLPHARAGPGGRASAPGGLAPRAGDAAPRREAARPRTRRPLDLLHPAPTRPARQPAAVPAHSPRKLLPGEGREAK